MSLRNARASAPSAVSQFLVPFRASWADAAFRTGHISQNGPILDRFWTDFLPHCSRPKLITDALGAKRLASSQTEAEALASIQLNPIKSD